MPIRRTLAEGTGVVVDPAGPGPETDADCHVCGGDIPKDSAYCPRCGTAVAHHPRSEPGPADSDRAESGSSAGEDFIPGWRSEAYSQDAMTQSAAEARKPVWLRLLSATVILAVIGALSFAMWTFAKPRPEVALADESATNITSYFERLEGAARTSDMRDVAGDAAGSRAEVKNMIGTLDEADDTTLVLKSYLRILTGVAGLRAINSNNLDRWSDSRSKMKTGLRFLPDDHESTHTLTTTGNSAIAAVGLMVDGAQEELDTWAAEVDRIEQRNQDVLDQRWTLSESRDGLLSVHSDYGDVRDETREMDADVDGGSEEFYDVKVFFERGVEQREGLLARLDDMYVPAVMSEVHSQFRSAFSQGLETMRGASDALNLAWQCPADEEYKCLQTDPRWAHYEDSSSSITPQLVAAVDQMNAVHEEQMQLLSTEDIPEQPKV